MADIALIWGLIFVFVGLGLFKFDTTTVQAQLSCFRDLPKSIFLSPKKLPK